MNEHPAERVLRLRRMKRLATGLLVAMVVLFVVSSLGNEFLFRMAIAGVLVLGVWPQPLINLLDGAVRDLIQTLMLAKA